MDKRSRRDLLSDLPLSIIHVILALVPIRDAVKTSILSRRWRYIWATLPHLNFDDSCASEKTSMNDFITRALFLHKGPIHKFKLFSLKHYCSIDQWLLFLSRNDIKMLIVKNWNMDKFKFHSSIYSCESLIHLELQYCEILPPPPTFKGFLRLRCLSLHEIDVHPDVIESLVANSPLLEEFEISDDGCEDYKFEWSKLKIRAPVLKKFIVIASCKEVILYAPLLTKMSATLVPFDFAVEPLQQQKNSPCNYTEFLGGLTNLEELAGGFLTKYLSIGIESYHNSLVLHHLRVIDISEVCFNDDAKQIWVAIHLITSAPNLHKLQISCQFRFHSKHTSDIASISFWDSESEPNFRLERLKVIKMQKVRGLINEMKLIKSLLASSPVLESLSFNPSDDLTDRKLLNLTAELLSYRRASTNAQINFSPKNV